METKMHPEVMPPETHIQSDETKTGQRFSPKTLILAFTIAVVSDAVSFFLALTPPFQWTADLVTALLLFAVLGRQWILLPGLIMEAVPGFSIFPIWLLVVGAVAYTGKVQRKG